MLICFCSAYVIPLFGRCSRVLDPALNSSPLTEISYSEFSLHVSWSLPVLNFYLKQKFTALGYYCSAIWAMVDYFWFSASFLLVFFLALVVSVNVYFHITVNPHESIFDKRAKVNFVLNEGVSVSFTANSPCLSCTFESSSLKNINHNCM